MAAADGAEAGGEGRILVELSGLKGFVEAQAERSCRLFQGMRRGDDTGGRNCFRYEAARSGAGKLFEVRTYGSFNPRPRPGGDANKSIGGPPMSEEQAKYTTLTPQERKLLDKVKATPWGTVTAKIKDGNIVIIERTETSRLD